MAIKIQFDPVHNPELPTMVLARKNGEKLGQLNVKKVVISDDLNNPSEISFVVNKFVDRHLTEHWNDIVDFKLLHCVEWDEWFEIRTEISEDVNTQKTVYCTGLSEAELSQIMLYNIEINTEIDIERDDYKNPTILWKPTETKESLLHRLLYKAPHYQIIHVDSTISSIQRTFSFDGVSIYDAFKQIEEEIGCIFIFDNGTDENGNIVRGISVYDLESNCLDCGHRDRFTTICPKCNSHNILEGYGEDTAIYLDVDEWANSIQLTTDVDAVKNCFKLEGGDDLMTATIRSCNPNGTDYIWYLSDMVKSDMSKELVSKLNEYDSIYKTYQNTFQYDLPIDIVLKYNALVSKYQKYDSTLSNITSIITSYPNLTLKYYDTIDFALYLQSVLMPDAKLSDTSADEQLNLLNGSITSVSTTDIKYLSQATADNLVTQMAKAIIDSKYKVEVVNSSLTKGELYFTWYGTFKITNYSDSEDTATSETPIRVLIDSNYKSFVEQKLQKALHDKEKKDYSIVGLFALSDIEFIEELKKYCLDTLTIFQDCCQGCIDVLIEQDIANPSTWADKNPNLYNEVYLPYYNKLKYIEAEMLVRENEISIISGVKDITGNVVENGVQNYLLDRIKSTQETLDFESFLGIDLWNEFIIYRREDKYSNSNYISDGLSNAELFKKALEFVDVAQREIYKSAELQHSITSSLKNLLLLPKFEPLLDCFSVGNWIRICIDDIVYKLRLLKYEIDFDNLSNISVEFSDVFKTVDGLSDQQSIISRASQMTTSYPSTQRQASQGSKSNAILDDWSRNGLSATNTKIFSGTAADGQTQTWDEHGMLFKRFNPTLNDYDPIQMKIINSTLAITSDNWKSVRTAIGNFTFENPETHEMENVYGVNAETIIGKIILGEQLGIYNSGGSLKFNQNGLSVTNGKNFVAINPNDSSSIFNIKNKKNEDILNFDEVGDLNIKGKIVAQSISTGAKTSSLVKANGLFIDDKGNLYAGLNNQIYIGADGTFSFGGVTGISYDGSVVYLGDDVNISWSNLPDDVAASSDIPTSLSWDNVTNKPTNLASTNDIPTDEYITKLTKDTITTTYLKTLNLTVGNEIQMGENAVLSWSNLPDDVAASSDIPTSLSSLNNDSGYQTATQVTQITKNTITTDYINALNIKAGSVDAENITGETITGKKIVGCTGEFSGKLIVGDGSTIGGLSVNGNILESGAIKIYTGDNLNGSYINLGNSIDHPNAMCSIHGTGVLFNAINSGNCFGAYRVQQINGKMYTSLSLDYANSQGVTTNTIWMDGANGIINCVSLYELSDEREKNINIFEDLYDTILMNLSPISYTWKNKEFDSKIHLGFASQNTYDIFKSYNLKNHSITTYSKEKDRYMMNYSELHALEVYSIQKNREYILNILERLNALEQ